MKDLDYFVLEKLTKDEFEELTKKYGAFDQKGMPKDIWYDWAEYVYNHKEETRKFMAPLIKKEVEELNKKEKKEWIDLPYTFDIYNKGPKNKGFILSIRTMRNIVNRAEHRQVIIDNKEKGTYKDIVEHNFNGTFRCQLPPDAIHFVGTDDNATDNFKKNPNIKTQVYNTTVYFSKPGETPSWEDMCKGWQYYFEMVFNQFKGKVTFIVDRDKYNEKGFILKFADPNIQNDIKEKIKYMKDPERVKELKIEWDKKWDDFYKEQRKIYYDSAINLDGILKQQKEYRIKRVKELEDELIKKGIPQREIDKQVTALLYDFYNSDAKELAKRNKYWGD